MNRKKKSQAPAPSRSQAVRSTWQFWLMALFFLSGFCSLMDEVIWVRLLKLVLGNTVYASSIVVSVFMGGLALGSFLMGRWADRWSRPLLVYAWLEVAVTLSAAVMPVALDLAYGVYRWFFQQYHPSAGAMHLLQIGVSTGLLLVPTVLMGSTLPLLSRQVTAAGDHIGHQVGRLYALNTLGAAAGCFAAGFLAIRLWGIMGSVYLAAGINALVAFGGWRLSRLVEAPASPWATAPSEPKGALPGKTNTPPWLSGGLLAAALVSGLISIGYELIWMRTIELPLGGFTYVFSAVLTVYLLGNVLGAWLGSHLVRRHPRPVLIYGLSFFCLGIFGLLYIPWFYTWFRHGAPLVEQWFPFSQSNPDYHKAWLPLLHGLVLFFLPSVAMGLGFPLVLEAWHQTKSRVAQSTGLVYGCNTVGAVLGGVITGFLLIPTLGAQKAITVLGLAGVWLGAGLIAALGPSRPAWKRFMGLGAALVITVAAALSPADLFLKVMRASLIGELLSVKEGTTTTVAITQKPDGHRLMAIDYIQMAGDDIHRSAQKTLGHLGLLLHPTAQAVLTFGFGTGETTACLAQHDVARIDCVEIAPEVVEAGLRYFSHINLGAQLNQRVNLHYLDGKNFLRLTDRHYDVIINDSNMHSTSGSAPLFTREHFQAALDHLRPGGLFLTKLHLQGYPPSHFRNILGTFLEVFPHLSIWFPTTKPFVFFYLVGSREPQQFSPQSIETEINKPAVRPSLAYLHLGNSLDFLTGYMGDEQDVRRYLGRHDVNSDYHPVVEFSLDSGRLVLRDYFPEMIAQLRQGSIRDHLDWTGFTADGKRDWMRRFALYEQASGYVLQAHGEQSFLSRLMNSYLGLRILPDYAPLLEQRAICLTDIEKALSSNLVATDQTIANMDRQILAYPDFATAWLVKAIALRYQNQMDRAVEAAETAARLAPTLPEAEAYLASLWQLRGNAEQATLHRKKAAALRAKSDRSDAAE